MSDRLKISPEQFGKAGLIGTGLLVVGLGSLFSFQMGDPFRNLKDLLSYAGVTNRVIDSTIATMREKGMSSPTLPGNNADLSVLGQLFGDELPDDIGTRSKPGRTVIQILTREL